MRTADQDGKGRRFPEGIRGIVVLIALYLALSATFIFTVPLWEAPDEPAHFIRIRAEARNLGLVDGDEPNRWLFPPGGEAPPAHHPGLILQRQEGFWKKGTVVSGYERHQPPIYYVLAAPLLAMSAGNDEPPFFFNHQYETRLGQVFHHGADRDPPFVRVRRTVLLLRLLSTVLGALTLVLVWLTARHLISGSGRWTAFGAVALIAFLPQFVFITSVINNDALALALSALFFFILVRSPEARPVLSPVRGVLLVLTFSAALLTEFSLVFLLPAALVYLAVTIAGDKRLRTAAIFAAAVLLPTLILFVAARQFTASGPLWNPARQLSRMGKVGVGLLQWESLREAMRFFFTSAWGVFGWMSVLPPPLLSAAYIGVTAITMIGLIRLLGPASRNGSAPRPAVGVRMLFATALICLTFLVVRNTLFTFQPQGRMFFPLLPLVAPLAAAGLQRIGPRIPGRLCLPVIAFMLGASLYGLFGMIRPFYPEVRAPITFNLPAESAILYGLYGAGFEVNEHVGSSTVARLGLTGALRLHNPGDREVDAALQFTAATDETRLWLEVWTRQGPIGSYLLEPGASRFIQLQRLTLPPGETVLFLHLAGDGNRGSCRVSGLTIASPDQ